MPDLPITTGDRIAIIGDSIIDYGGRATYDQYIGTWLHLYRPNEDFSVWTLARSGASLGGFIDTWSDVDYQHYSKWVAAMEPKYVIFGFADNGAYTQENEFAGVNALINNHIVGVSEAEPILVGMIPMAKEDGYYRGGWYDENHQLIAEAATPDWLYQRTWDTLEPLYTVYQTMTATAADDTINGIAHGFVDGERVLMETFAAPGGLAGDTYYWVRDAAADTFKVASTEGGNAIDITTNGGAMNWSSNWARLRNSASDSIHPSNAGSILAAITIWRGLGWGTDISTATIDATTALVTTQDECIVTNISPNVYGGIDFLRLDNRLPWAVSETWLGTGRVDVNALDPTTIGWQNYNLTVTGLVAGTYDVVINGTTVASVTHTELNSGWNMADLTSGPVWEKGQAVLAAQRNMLGMNTETLVFPTMAGDKWGVSKYKDVATYQYKDLGKRIPELTSILASNIASVETLNDAVISAAQPETLSFSIRRQGFVPDGNTNLDSRINLALSADVFPMPPGIPAPMWGTTDPINSAVPVWPTEWPSAVSTGNYYIDKTHPQATDSLNTYGYPNKPRMTIPDWATLGAGKRMEVAHGSYSTSGGDSVLVLRPNGTETDPCWYIFGSDTLISGSIRMYGEYAIFEGLNFYVNMLIGYSSTTTKAPARYICMRRLTIDGLSNAGGGSALAISGYSTSDPLLSPAYADDGSTHDIIVFDSDIRNLGDPLVLGENDFHGINPAYYTHHIWILGCRVHSVNGDSIQGTGNGAFITARNHHMYIGYNKFYSNGENAVDLKSTVDTVISSNIAYDFSPQRGSDGTAFVVQQENGSGCENIWVIFNEIYDCNYPIRSEETNSSVYFIGNIVHDVIDADPEQVVSLEDSYSAVKARGGSATSLYAIDNTLYNYESAALWFKAAGSTPTIRFRGNLLAGRASPTGWDLWGVGTIGAGQTVDYNLYDATAPRLYHGSTYTDLATWTAAKGFDANSIIADPELADPVNGNFAPLGTSAAIGANTEDTAYATFEAYFGEDIRVDFYGNNRPSSGAWSIGAVELAGFAPPELQGPQSPTFSVTRYITPSIP